MASIRKQKNGYLIRVSCGYSNGHQNIQSMTWTPDSNMTAKQADKEAKRQAVLFEEQCRNGITGTSKNIKLADFCNLYLDIKKDILAPRTYEYYNWLIGSLIVPVLGHIKLSELKPVHIQQFIKCMQENEDNSPATIKRKLAVLQSVLKLAVKLELIPSSPADAERLTLPKVTAPKIEIFSRQEVVKMLSYLENEPLQFQVLIQLAIMTGARLGELAGLKFSDIDYQNRKITIERSAYKATGEPIVTKLPKDNDIRTIAVNSHCIELMERLKSEKEKQAIEHGSEWIDGDWLFTQCNGEIMNPQTLSKQFSNFLKKNGLKHRKFHSLRHTSATLLLYGGVNIKQVQERLGHGNITTTNLYLHCISKADEEAVNILQDMLITKKNFETVPDNNEKTG